MREEKKPEVEAKEPRSFSNLPISTRKSLSKVTVKKRKYQADEESDFEVVVQDLSDRVLNQEFGSYKH